MSPLRDEFLHFLILAKHKSISRSAEIAGIRQSGLSKSLRRLEQNLGVQLFSRSKWGIQLTAEGEKFYKTVEQLETVWKGSLRTQDSDALVGQIKLGCHPALAVQCLPRFYPQICEKYMGIQFDVELLNSATVTRKVISADLDLGIAVNPIRQPELVIYKLYGEQVGVWQCGGGEAKIIYYNPEMKDIFNQLRAFNTMRQIAVADYNVISILLVESDGLAILPDFYAPLGSRMVKKLFDGNICLIYRKDRSKNRISQLIVKEIRKRFD